jgi:hypothetical protein
MKYPGVSSEALYSVDLPRLPYVVALFIFKFEGGRR